MRDKADRSSALGASIAAITLVTLVFGTASPAGTGDIRRPSTTQRDPVLLGLVRAWARGQSELIRLDPATLQRLPGSLIVGTGARWARVVARSPDGRAVALEIGYFERPVTLHVVTLDDMQLHGTLELSRFGGYAYNWVSANAVLHFNGRRLDVIDPRSMVVRRTIRTASRVGFIAVDESRSGFTTVSDDGLGSTVTARSITGGRISSKIPFRRIRSGVEDWHGSRRLPPWARRAVQQARIEFAADGVLGSVETRAVIPLRGEEIVRDEEVLDGRCREISGGLRPMDPVQAGYRVIVSDRRGWADFRVGLEGGPPVGQTGLTSSCFGDAAVLERRGFRSPLPQISCEHGRATGMCKILRWRARLSAACTSLRREARWSTSISARSASGIESWRAASLARRTGSAPLGGAARRRSWFSRAIREDIICTPSTSETDGRAVS